MNGISIGACGVWIGAPIRKSSTYNNGEHARCVFFASEVAGHDEDDDSDGYGGDREVEFAIVMFDDDDDELDRKAEEEEEVEFEEGNIDLGQSVWRSQFCNAVFKGLPGKLDSASSSLDRR